MSYNRIRSLSTSDVGEKLNVSSFRLFIRITSFAILISSLFTKEWFCLSKVTDSLLIKVGLFRYCDEDQCFSFPETSSKYFNIKFFKINTRYNFIMANNGFCINFIINNVFCDIFFQN